MNMLQTVTVICRECGDPVDGPYNFHPSCCEHVDAMPALTADGTTEVLDFAHCLDCGVFVRPAVDEDGPYFEIED
jgi:hypothetical protein